MDAKALNVVQRYKASLKEKPETKRNRLFETIRAIGISLSVAKDIADKFVAKHGNLAELMRLALQKGWSLNDGIIEGSKGSLDLASLT